MKTKHPVDFILFGVPTSNEYIMNPVIFLHSFTLNMDAYINDLKVVVLPL